MPKIILRKRHFGKKSKKKQKIFGHMKKKQYFCTIFRVLWVRMTQSYACMGLNYWVSCVE